jgi:hypothetical protein
MAPHDYHALAETNAGKERARLLHLVREDAEASLCGIPKSSLGHAGTDLVCPECLDWLPRRRAASGVFQAVRRPA